MMQLLGEQGKVMFKLAEIQSRPGASSLAILIEVLPLGPCRNAALGPPPNRSRAFRFFHFLLFPSLHYDLLFRYSKTFNRKTM